MDISALRDRTDTAMTVSELNAFIKSMFDSNRLLTSVHIRGEISNLVNHRSGHIYFSLKDADGEIRAVMFRSSAARLKFVPENGMKVTVYGSVTVYERNGSYQLYAASMQPDGIGALYLAYEQLKARLAAEGLFDDEHKVNIPQFPSRVGVITSPTGAAVRDIINVLGRRSPMTVIYVYPALVQGEGAAATLIDGVEYFDKSGLVDTIIIGRGGGSIEDLWAFNDEGLARKIFECRIPIISAVGHETDYTICDFVADLRAPTPSAAAELCVPDVRDLALRLDSLYSRADRSLCDVLRRKRESLTFISSLKILTNPIESVLGFKERISSLQQIIKSAGASTLAEHKHALVTLAGRLEALNPLSVICRGYSVAQMNGRSVSSVSEVEPGDEMYIRMIDGGLDVKVLNKNIFREESIDEKGN